MSKRKRYSPEYKRQSVNLPEGWKTTVALQLVSSWAQQGVTVPDPVLAVAAKLYATLRVRFASTAQMPIPN